MLVFRHDKRLYKVQNIAMTDVSQHEWSYLHSFHPIATVKVTG